MTQEVEILSQSVAGLDAAIEELDQCRGRIGEVRVIALQIEREARASASMAEDAIRHGWPDWQELVGAAAESKARLAVVRDAATALAEQDAPRAVRNAQYARVRLLQRITDLLTVVGAHSAYDACPADGDIDDDPGAA